jgi:hypothetical protein
LLHAYDPRRTTVTRLHRPVIISPAQPRTEPASDVYPCIDADTHGHAIGATSPFRSVRRVLERHLCRRNPLHRPGAEQRVAHAAIPQSRAGHPDEQAPSPGHHRLQANPRLRIPSTRGAQKASVGDAVRLENGDKQSCRPSLADLPRIAAGANWRVLVRGRPAQDRRHPLGRRAAMRVRSDATRGCGPREARSSLGLGFLNTTGHLWDDGHPRHPACPETRRAILPLLSSGTTISQEVNQTNCRSQMN